MTKRWYQFATVDERWTFATWIVFLGVTGILFAGFWLVAGHPWINFLKTICGATGDVVRESVGYGDPDAALVMPAAISWFGFFALFVPFVFSMIPALAVLLGISNWLTREKPEDDAEL